MLGGRAVKLHSLTEKAKLATGMRQLDAAAPVVIGVVGLPGSGKRTFCGMLSATLGSEGVLMISEDIYRKRVVTDCSPPFREAWRLEVAPSTFEESHMSSHLDDLSSGCSIFVPEYDWELRETLTTWQLLQPRPVILVEGLFLFSGSDLARHFDCRVFLDARPETCLGRLLSRGGEAVSQPPGWDERFRRFSEEFVEPQRDSADIIIPADTPFETSVLDLCANVLDEVFARRKR